MTNSRRYVDPIFATSGLHAFGAGSLFLFLVYSEEMIKIMNVTMTNRFITFLTALLYLFSPSFVWGEDIVLKDGRKLVIENKTCDTCPPPSMKLIGIDGGVISSMPAKEKELIFSTIIVGGDRYLVTSTTGGEGAIRVYDIHKKSLIKTIQPFGTPKTWGSLFDLGNNEFSIMSPPQLTYLRPNHEFTKAVVYSIQGDSVKEVTRFENIQKSERIYGSFNGNRFLASNNDSVFEIDRRGGLLRSIKFEDGLGVKIGKPVGRTRWYEGFNIYDSLPQADGVTVFLAAKGTDFYMIKIAGEVIEIAPLVAAKANALRYLKESGEKLDDKQRFELRFVNGDMHRIGVSFMRYFTQKNFNEVSGINNLVFEVASMAKMPDNHWVVNVETGCRKNPNGTLTDGDGIIWQLCLFGQSWENGQCNGSPKAVSWYDAMEAARSSNFAGKNDWILPSSAFLKGSINPKDCKHPNIPMENREFMGGYRELYINNHFWTADTGSKNGGGTAHVTDSRYAGGYNTVFFDTSKSASDFDKGYESVYAVFIRNAPVSDSDKFAAALPLVKCNAKCLDNRKAAQEERDRASVRSGEEWRRSGGFFGGLSGGSSSTSGSGKKFSCSFLCRGSMYMKGGRHTLASWGADESSAREAIKNDAEKLCMQENSHRGGGWWADLSICKEQ